MTFSIHGLPVARGIAIGRAVLVGSSRVEVAHYFITPEQIPAEIDRVRVGRNAPAPQRRGLRLNDNGRWGLDFNLNQPVGRETDWGDVEAGAYYRLNDRLRVGAAAAVSTPEADPARAPETNGRAQPRVRLETIFKF